MPPSHDCVQGQKIETITIKLGVMEESIAPKIDDIHKVLFGNGVPGIKTKVDRLEQWKEQKERDDHDRKEKFDAKFWAIILLLIGQLLTWGVTKYEENKNVSTAKRTGQVDTSILLQGGSIASRGLAPVSRR